MSVPLADIVAVLRIADQLSPTLKNIADTVRKSGQQMAEDFKRVGEAWEKTGRQVSEVGLAITKVTAPLAAAALGATKFSTDFETSTTKLVTLSGVSEEAMRGMREEILKLAPVVGIGPRALADALLVVTSTGIRGAEAMQILEVSAKASAVGLGETKDVARAITSAMTAYGVENLSAAKAGEILFKTVREGGAEANELAGVLGRVVGIASQVGVSFNEVGAFMATFTRLGVDSAEAVTALRGVLSTVMKPTKEAREQLQAMGWSIEALRASIKEKGLTAALAELINRTKGNDDAIAAIVPNVRAMAAVLGTAGAQAKAAAENARILTADSDDIVAAFKRVSGTAGFTFSQLLAGAGALAIKFGNSLAPSLAQVALAAKPLLSSAESLVKWFGNLPGSVQTSAIAFGALTVALGPVLFIAGQLITSIGTIIKIAPLLGSAWAIATGPVGIAVIAVMGLVAAVIKFRQQMTDMAKPLSAGQVIEGLKDDTGKLKMTLDQAREAMNELGGASDGTISGLKNGLKIVVTEAGKVGPAVKAITVLTEEQKKAVAELAASYGNLSSLSGTWKQALTSLDGKVLEGIRYYVDRGAKTEDIARIYGLLPAKVDAVKAAFAEETKVLAKAAEEAEAIASANRNMAYGLRDLREALPLPTFKAFVGYMEKLPTAVMSGAVGIQNLGKLLKTGLMDTLKDVPQMMVNAFTGGGDTLGALKGIGSQMGSVIGKAVATAGKSAGELAAGFGSMLGPIGAAIGSMAGPLIGGIAKLFGGVSEETKKARASVADFERQFGGVENMITAVSAAYLATGRSAATAQIDIKALWDSSSRGADATKAAIDKVQQAFEEQAADTQRAKELVSEYQIAVEKTGPAWRNQELSAQVKALVNDTRILVDVVGMSMPDAVGVLSGRFNEFVKTAQQTGFEVPASMKPILQQAIDLGALVDANGVAFKSLEGTGLTFAETFGQSVDRLIVKFEEFMVQLGLLPPALMAIPDIDISANVHYNYDRFQIPDMPSQDTSGYATGTLGVTGGFWRDFGAGTPTVLHGTEAVVRPDQAAAFAQATGGGAGNWASEIKSELQALRRDFLTGVEMAARHGAQTAGRRI